MGEVTIVILAVVAIFALGFGITYTNTRSSEE